MAKTPHKVEEYQEDEDLEFDEAADELLADFDD